MEVDAVKKVSSTKNLRTDGASVKSGWALQHDDLVRILDAYVAHMETKLEGFDGSIGR